MRRQGKPHNQDGGKRQMGKNQKPRQHNDHGGDPGGRERHRQGPAGPGGDETRAGWRWARQAYARAQRVEGADAGRTQRHQARWQRQHRWEEASEREARQKEKAIVDAKRQARAIGEKEATKLSRGEER